MELKPVDLDQRVYVMKRKPIKLEEKIFVFKKTGGRCHICGKVLFFDAVRGEKGRWHVDHIVPVARGGRDRLKNFIPICNICNRLKWDFKGRKIRKLLQFGVITWRESERKTSLGKGIKILYQQRLKQNKSRRKGELPGWYYR